MKVLRSLEHLLALTCVVWLVLVGVLLQTTGASTPCRAVAHKAIPHVPGVAAEVVEACIGAKGEGGLAGLVIEFGLALTGNGRDKLQKRVQEKLEMDVRAGLLETGELRCTIILAEGLVGRANGGPRHVVTRMGEEHKFACRGEDKAGPKR